MSSHDEFRQQAKRDHAAKVKHHAGGGAVMKGEKALIERAVAQHESHDHPGKPKTKLKLATGGVAEDRAPARLDRARGGKAKSGKGHTNVNVIVAPPHPPGPPGGMMPPPGMAPHPPMPPPGAGGPPGAGLPPGLPPGGPGLPPGAAGPGGPPGAPMMKPPGMKVGGLVKAGSGSAEGRKDKIKAYGGR